LMGSKSWDEVVERCKVFAAENPEAEWITGRGWDETLWENPQMPDNSLLNEIFPDKPVFIRRVDGHAGIANAKAIALANISAETKIEGGDINVKTGLLIDNAMPLVSNMVPAFSRKQMEKGLIKAGEICNNFGLTTLADAGLDPEQIFLIDSLRNAGKIHLRFYTMLSYSPQNLAYAKNQGATKTDFLRINGFKFYADGALGSSGAKLKQPYCGSEFHIGLQLTSTEELRHAFYILDSIGFQANTHCIGDSANRLVLGLYNEVLQGKQNKRWRIEHAQVLDLEDLSLFGKNYIIPSVQPIHATSDMRMAEKRLCSHRMGGAYAYKKLLDQTGIIAIGTDFPVEKPDPFANFYAAVARKNTEHLPSEGFLPEDKISTQEALSGMTRWAAYSLFMDDIIGNFEKGKKADFVVLDVDLLFGPQENIVETKVMGLYLEGVRRN